MKKEIRIFFTALMFYTRIPCPSWVDHSEDYINKATRYFPLIGWIVGGASALTIFGLHFIFPSSICVMLSLATSILITGAFHEDGWADVCDGFGGGWSEAKILDIMKDSRVGAYGAIGLIVLIGLKIFILLELLNIDLNLCITATILAHVVSRFAAVTMIFTHEYARDDESSKIKPIAKKLTLSNFLISSIWLIPAFILMDNYWYLLVIFPVYFLKMYLAKYFTKWIGGYTGDCLGATQQLTEVVSLLFCLGLCKYI